MTSNSRNPWEKPSPHAQHRTDLEELSAWLKAAGITSHPLLCIVYGISFSLGFFVAKAHVEQVSSAAVYALIALGLGVYSGLHSLRSRSISGIIYMTMAAISSVYLVVQSEHPWLSLVLFACVTLALFAVTPSIYKDTIRPTSRINTYVSHAIISLILFGTTYAVLTQNFAPYYLALIIPILTMTIVMTHASRLPSLCAFPACFVMLALVTNYVPSVKPEQSQLCTAVAKKVLERQSSLNTQERSQDAMDRGVVYGFGVKNSKTGSIDCSGWVEEINRKLMRTTNEHLGREVYDDKARLALKIGANGGAAGIVLAVAVATGTQLLNEDLTPDKVREGLTIGLDTGVKSWDSGRYGGIDHIVQTFKDPKTGEIMISQSSGGVGVNVVPYADWYAEWNEKAKLYGVDMSLLASPAPVPSL